MNIILNRCLLCPKNCGVNRNKGELGFCRTGNKLKIAKAYLHMWEEPPITGKNGSGTIFFSNCNLRCIFCQNYEISDAGRGREIDTKEFADICLKLQSDGASNINLVTPTHFVPLIIDGIKLAKEKGLCIPVVYNSSGYENVETIKMLEGIVDIYLPDFKYFSNDLAMKYSGVNNYFEYASRVIKEMTIQQPKCIFKDGVMKKGVIIRHLLIPGMVEDSKKVLEYLYNEYKNKVYISIMNQYTPVRECKYKELNRVVTAKEYDEIINYAWNLGIRNAFIQEEGTQKDSFIPKWDF